MFQTESWINDWILNIHWTNKQKLCHDPNNNHNHIHPSEIDYCILFLSYCIEPLFRGSYQASLIVSTRTRCDRGDCDKGWYDNVGGNGVMVMIACHSNSGETLDSITCQIVHPAIQFYHVAQRVWSLSILTRSYDI